MFNSKSTSQVRHINVCYATFNTNVLTVLDPNKKRTVIFKYNADFCARAYIPESFTPYGKCIYCP